MSEKRRVVAVIPCNNLAASEDFYGLLGFRRDPDSEDYGDYVILTDDGGAEIHLTKAAEDWLAGRIDDDAHHRTLSVASLASLRLSESVVIEGCPAWCNAHNFSYGDQAEDDVNLHHHIVEGEGWKVELEEGCSDTGGSVQLIGACGEEIPLGTARAYAMALLAACDSVEGCTTTG